MRASSILAGLLLPLATLAQQTPFLRPASSYHPISIIKSVEPSGSLLRTQTIYSLQHSGGDGVDWIVGIKGQEGTIEARESGRDRPVLRLGRNEDVTYYKIRPTPSTDGSIGVTISSVVSQQTEPLPKTVSQTDSAFSMLWSADLFDLIAPLSPSERAKVEEVKLKFKAPTPKIHSSNAPQTFEVSHTKGSATVTFTSKSDFGSATTPQIASVHYTQPSALASFRTLERTVEVSHWGSSLSVQEDIDLVNIGPELKGQFSRLEHQKAVMQRRANALAVTALGIAWPPNVHSPYFYDIVGNVSTSRFRTSDGSSSVGLPSQKKKAGRVPAHSMLELSPRYPLMGGWNYTFTVGYIAPLSDYLKRGDGSNYVLSIPFLTPIKDISSDNVTVTIRLPEGASNIRVHTPFPVDSQTFPTVPGSVFSSVQGYTKTYLDSTGRPTIVLTKANCTDRHSNDIIIEYTLSFFAEYLQKPLVVATAILLITLTATGLKKLEWGISSR